MGKNSYSTDVIDIEEVRAERRRKRQEALAKKQKRSKDSAEAAKKIKTKRGKRKLSKRRLVYFAIALALIIVLAVSALQIVFLKNEQKEADREYDQALREKAEKERELSRVNDPEYIEEQARNRLRMIRPGELLYVFPDLEEEDAQTDDTDR